MVTADRTARRRRARARLLVAIGVGLWAALVWRGPREGASGAGACDRLLSAWIGAQQRFFEANGRYTTALREVRVSTEAQRDVLLVADPHGTVRGPAGGSYRSGWRDTVLASSVRAASAPPSVLPAVVEGGAPVGLEGACPSCAITLACIENLDGDSDFSVWSVSSKDRQTPAGRVIRGGQPWREHDDLAPLAGAPAYAEFLR